MTTQLDSTATNRDIRIKELQALRDRFQLLDRRAKQSKTRLAAYRAATLELNTLVNERRAERIRARHIAEAGYE